MNQPAELIRALFVLSFATAALRAIATHGSVIQKWNWRTAGFVQQASLSRKGQPPASGRSDA